MRLSNKWIIFQCINMLLNYLNWWKFQSNEEQKLTRKSHSSGSHYGMQLIPFSLNWNYWFHKKVLVKAYLSSLPPKFHWHIPTEEAANRELTPDRPFELCRTECMVWTGLLVGPLISAIGLAVWRISNTISMPFCKSLEEVVRINKTRKKREKKKWH